MGPSLLFSNAITVGGVKKIVDTTKTLDCFVHIFGNDFFAKKLQYQINVERKAQTNIANSENSLF